MISKLRHFLEIISSRKKIIKKKYEENNGKNFKRNLKYTHCYVPSIPKPLSSANVSRMFQNVHLAKMDTVCVMGEKMERKFGFMLRLRF